ncbi:MAG: response regulator transcription factor [Gammaproteobacteria bacterium]|nr:response regulator transcription factor [Gammaproteobacteria bacterium]
MRIRVYSLENEHARLSRVLRVAGHRVISDDRRLPLLEADLVLVHWRWLSGDTGNDLATLRRVHAESAVWVIGVPSDPAVALRVFAQGADDCIPEVFGDAVLLAKMVRLTGRVTDPVEVSAFGSYHFLDDHRTVVCDGEEVFLTDKEYALALYLFRSSGELVRREDLIRQIWGTGTQLNSRSVDVHLSRVRKKLRLEENSGWVLGSVYGQGYRLMPMGGDRACAEHPALHQRHVA